MFIPQSGNSLYHQRKKSIFGPEIFHGDFDPWLDDSELRGPQHGHKTYERFDHGLQYLLERKGL